ncbi:MAG TPA: GTP-binding protein [Candidatus Polarisedimenticolaceae bacterium]|nr:GTP-binding protein [Candidatus Polarisedimenticolaceae bacterium]
MTQQSRGDLRNLAIIAHVDHGKTTLVDAMLWQSGIFGETGDVADRVTDSIDLEREKGIPVMPPIVSVAYRGIRIHIVDVPGHADFGRGVDRALQLVDGLLLVVDASEGPLPQTRFALRRALEAGLAPIVVVNKIDLPGARPDRVVDEVRELFVDLDARPEQLAFPALFCNARRGQCRLTADGEDHPLLPLFEEIVGRVPAPRFAAEQPVQFRVSSIDYDDYLGRLAVGRVVNGSLELGGEVMQCHADGTRGAARIAGLFAFDGLRRIEAEQAGPGEIVCVSGLEGVAIGDTLTDRERPVVLPPLPADDPTLSMSIAVNDSPMAGVEGTLTSADDLRERLFRELLTNPLIHVEETASTEVFTLSGCSELQLAILIEMMRREGYELSVGKPAVLTRKVDGAVEEPIELLVVDCPEEYVAVVTEKIGPRRGHLARMVNHGTGRVRLEFRLPTRGLFGFRAEFLSDTRGAGILNHRIESYQPWQGEIAGRSTGALIADRPGRATAFAIEHLQPRGTIFVAPGDEVYEGMIVGENSRANDLIVNITKEKRPSPGPTPARRPAVHLIPPRSMSLEQALEFLRDDDLVEVTPRSVRLRKKILQAAVRQRNT